MALAISEKTTHRKVNTLFMFAAPKADTLQCV